MLKKKNNYNMVKGLNVIGDKWIHGKKNVLNKGVLVMRKSK